MNEPDDREQLVAVFLAEADEQLTQLDDELRLLVDEGANEERIASLFRTAHTFKGNASIVGFGRLSSLAHSLEEVLDFLRRQLITVDAQLISALHEAVEVLRQAVLVIARSGDDAIDDAWLAVFARLRTLGGSGADLPVGLADRPPPRRTLTPAERSLLAQRTVRVDVARLDRLLSLLSDLLVVRTDANRVIDRIPTDTRELRTVVDAHRNQEAILHELRFELMQARLVPIGQLFRRFERRITELAAGLGKQATFVVEGGDITVDTAVLDKLRDPMMHLFRNAIDHGIEAPAIRRERGKPEVGRLLVAIRQVEAGIVIEVSDDGGGLAVDRIVERARVLALTLPDISADELAAALIFRSGLSTAEEVTELSGRGVGMDIVRRAVLSLRGTIDVESRAHIGTRFVLRLPLTVALVPSLFVRVASHVVALPLEQVVESFALARDQHRPDGTKLQHGDEALPYLALRALYAETGRGANEHVVIVAADHQRAALLVDEILGEHQAVLRPLGGLFADQASFAGATTMSDGRLALVLHVGNVLRKIAKERDAEESR